MIVVGVGIIDATEPTGIGDADNLAWKLASVIRGDAGPALLDTYEVERRPIAEQVIDISSRNSPAAGGYRIDDQLLLGTRYRSAAVQTDSTDGTSGLDQSEPPFRVDPGKRLPHTWLRPKQSTLDLVGCDAMVVVGEIPPSGPLSRIVLSEKGSRFGSRNLGESPSQRCIRSLRSAGYWSVRTGTLRHASPAPPL